MDVHGPLAMALGARAFVNDHSLLLHSLFGKTPGDADNDPLGKALLITELEISVLFAAEDDGCTAV